MSKLKFGVQLWQEQFSYEQMVEATEEVEEMGFDSTWLYDHFYPMSRKTSMNIPESWTLLSVLAAKTENIDLGVLVTCNSYRYPTVLAKIAATVDLVSDGRLQFAIGAGWHEEEHNAYDIPFPDAITRIERLSEALEIIKRTWTENKVNFFGDYYEVDGLVSYPKPIQDPYPPIWVGGQGNKMLKVVAEHADCSNFVDSSVDSFRDRLEVLEKRCSQVGRDYDEIEKTWHGHVIVDDDNESARKKALKFKENSTIKSVLEKSKYQYLKSVIFGDPETCAEKFRKYADLGVDYFIPHFAFDQDLSPQKIFMSKIAPQIRD